MSTRDLASRALCAVISLIGAVCLVACSSLPRACVPVEIKMVVKADGPTRVTLFRISPSNERIPSEFYLLPVEERVDLPPMEAAKVVSILGSRKTYGNDHLGCVSVGYGLRVERDGRRVDLLVDLGCEHLLDPRTGHDVGLLSPEGHKFFEDLLARHERHASRPPN